MIKPLVILLTSAIIAVSCNNAGKPETSRRNTTEKAGSIADLAQRTLMRNVSAALKKGGPEYALEFCNIRALPLTDSLSEASHVQIQRMTERNRNPENNLKTDTDQKIYKTFADNSLHKDTLITENGNNIYYKRINLGMPACTQCHGIADRDIAPATLKKILALYPEDKATGYRLNDFRGMWKITFSQKED